MSIKLPATQNKKKLKVQKGDSQETVELRPKKSRLLPTGRLFTRKNLITVGVLGFLGGALFTILALAGSSAGYQYSACTAASNYQDVTSRKDSGVSGYDVNGKPTKASCADQSAEGWVSRVNYALKGREVDSPDQYKFLVSKYLSNTKSPAQNYVALVLSQNETRVGFLKLSAEQKVKQLYKNVLGREADTGGLNYWSARLSDSKTLAASLTSFLQQNESLKNARPKVETSIAFSNLSVPNESSKVVNTRSLGAPASDKTKSFILTGRGEYKSDVYPSFADKLGESIVIGTFPTTNNQVKSTTDSMRVNAVDLKTGRNTWLSVPTNRLKNSAPAPNGKGGADVSDICTTKSGTQSVSYGISAVPYKHWDAAKLGEFPYMPRFVQRDGKVTYDAVNTLATYKQFRANAQSKALADRFLGIKNDEPLGSAGLGECATLPNGSIVIVQYFPGEGKNSGSVIVVSPDGYLEAGITLPSLKTADGRKIDLLLPRDVISAPKVINGKIYISVVSDSFGVDGAPVPFPITELTYEPSAKNLKLVSGIEAPSKMRFNRSTYNEAGDLFATTTVINDKDPLVAFRGAGIAHYTRSQLSALRAPTEGARMQVVNPKSSIQTPNLVLSSDIVYSEKHKILLYSSLTGDVNAYNPAKSYGICATLRPNLSAEIVRSDSKATFGNILKGVYDKESDFWWLPIRNEGTGLTSAPHLYGVNVQKLASKCKL